MEGLQRAENPTEEYQKFFGETLMGKGCARGEYSEYPASTLVPRPDY